MKKSILYLLVVLYFAPSLHAQEKVTSPNYQYCWQGKLGENIPVFLHFQKHKNLIVGEITYLNTKAKKPIPLIGRKYSKSGLLYLNEFTEGGIITGVWMLTPQGDSLTGHWYAPYSDEQYRVAVVKQDTLMSSLSISTHSQHISGEYEYHYGEKGPQGTWRIKRLDEHHITIKASAVTSAPARNLAYVSTDTVRIDNHQFVYKVGMDSDCKIVMQGTFYKVFLKVNYINDEPCRYYFGHNATLEGIFYKTEDE